jgi:hypothetical protein
LWVIDNGKYALIAINYYAFLKDKNKPIKTNFAPTEDVIFNRAYDILNYPSVGHFSGFVFFADLARQIIRIMLDEHSSRFYEKHRGIIGRMAVFLSLSTSLPAYFIGERLLANRMPLLVDYDSLRHLCLDYCQFFYQLHKGQLITKSDLDYRFNIVLNKLPRAIIVDSPNINKEELEKIIIQLKDYLSSYRIFNYVCLPLLKFAKYRFGRSIFVIIRLVGRLLKCFIHKINE